MSWRTLLVGFLVKDFLKLFSVSRPTLKVLIATSSKFLSISLNISQYLLEYIFRVSPSRMVIDNRESKGRGTLLQVTKRALNTLMSSLKELIELSLKPSNHLITTGPRLDGNTLHISFILWVNGHSLVEVASVLHRVCSTIIHGKRWLSKSPRKFSLFNPTCKRWLRNLAQGPAYSIITQIPVRWTFASSPIMAVLITWIRLTEGVLDLGM